MSETLVWWLLVQVVGLTALPLCLLLFRWLPDRGYTLSKPFALILVGYGFWLLNIVNVLPNSTPGIAWVLALLALASGYALWRRHDELVAFVRERWWLIAAVEGLLFVAFVTGAYLRSYTPEIAGTEKPMDFMFLNAMLRADGFPPHDPWLAGENVAYYYFGYLIVAIMTRLAGVEASIGYNLGLAMIAALAVVGVAGLVYNLAAWREERTAEAGPGTPAAGFPSPPLWRPMAFGLAAGLLLAMMGNLGGILEFLAAHNVGASGFWGWVGIENVSKYDSARWYPAGDFSQAHWFWWHATRIIDDSRGIHEFPFFSFLLGDLHPHVMSIPFVLLAVGAALALFRSGGDGDGGGRGDGARPTGGDGEPLDVVFWLNRPLWLVVLAIILGGLAFLNTWDMPTLAFVVVLAALLRNRLLGERWSWGLALDTAGFAAPLFLLAFLAYVPFFFGGFDSQASGFTAESGGGTRLFHALLIWGPFAVLVLPYVLWRLVRQGSEGITLRAVLWSLAPAAAVLFLWVVWDLLAKAFGWLPAGIRPNEAYAPGQPDLAAPLWDRLGRGTNWLTALVLSGVLALLVLALVREVASNREPLARRMSHVFALALAATAALLILGTEFIFIQDGFSSRMNTIFKLYYQSWLLLSVAGGFALYELTRGWRLPAIALPRAPTVEVSLGNWSLGELLVVAATFVGAVLGSVWLDDDLAARIVGALGGGGIFFVVSVVAALLWRTADGRLGTGALSWRAAWAGAAAVVLLAAFLYPLLATFNRTNGFDLPRTLDGLAYLHPDERAAVRWLAEQDGRPVVAEAVGDDYTEGGRVSAATGLPTPLQWPGHELQWRGTSEPQTGRREAIDVLYTSTSADEVRAVLQQYDIKYVFLGQVERQKYQGTALSQLEELFEPEPAFEQGEVVVYRVKPAVFSEVSRE